MKAKIIPVGSGLYGLIWQDEVKMYFPTVTDGQIFCIANFIPFEPWE